jgi:hypothetical protein
VTPLAHCANDARNVAASTIGVVVSEAVGKVGCELFCAFMVLAVIDSHQHSDSKQHRRAAVSCLS